MKFILTALLFIVTFAKGDIVPLYKTIEEPSTLPPPPKPYAFGYAAGRFPGHIDRTHSEVSDGSGIVQGSYSYVDPRHEIRTVEYVADKNGFHPISSHGLIPQQDTAAVAAAKNRHLIQFAQIAQSHQANSIPNVIVGLPVDSAAVNRAKLRHFTLYEKIAQQHARIAAERATLHSELDNEKQGTLKEIY